ncbi:MAG: Biopolymer transport protein ExbD/TolR [Bacteroidota bacterium]|nr:Biopolymer transport protein ExbD/TolR [Bacteroidota bacterium]
MADLDTSQGGGHGKHKGGVRGKKMSTRVDLTPMVDLAFLLISFFMLTTTLSKPVAMNLSMPKKEKPQDVKESKVISFIADKDDKLWYYEGTHLIELKTTDYSPEGIRKIILDKHRKVDAQFGLDKTDNSHQTICLIKMTDNANYKNMVDILDEMDITGTKIYAIQDLSPLEKEAIDNGGKIKSFAAAETTPSAAK